MKEKEELEARHNHFMRSMRNLHLAATGTAAPSIAQSVRNVSSRFLVSPAGGAGARQGALSQRSAAAQSMRRTGVSLRDMRGDIAAAAARSQRSTRNINASTRFIGVNPMRQVRRVGHAAHGVMPSTGSGWASVPACCRLLSIVVIGTDRLRVCLSPSLSTFLRVGRHCPLAPKLRPRVLLRAAPETPSRRHGVRFRRLLEVAMRRHRVQQGQRRRHGRRLGPESLAAAVCFLQPRRPAISRQFRWATLHTTGDLL
jgi:hypothetical protein